MNFNDIFSRKNCPNEQKLIAYKKGLVQKKEQHEIENHLLDCESCSDFLEGYFLIKNDKNLNLIVNNLNKKINRKTKKNISIKTWAAMAAAFFVFVSVAFFMKSYLFENKTELNSISKKEIVKKDKPLLADKVEKAKSLDENKKANLTEKQTKSEVVKNKKSEETPLLADNFQKERRVIIEEKTENLDQNIIADLTTDETKNELVDDIELEEEIASEIVADDIVSGEVAASQPSVVSEILDNSVAGLAVEKRRLKSSEKPSLLKKDSPKSNKKTADSLIKEYSRLLNIDSTNNEIIYKLAQAYLQKNDTNNAVNLLKKLTNRKGKFKRKAKRLLKKMAY